MKIPAPVAMLPLVLSLALCLPVPLPAQSQADLVKTGRVQLVAEARVSDDGLPEGVLFQNPRCLAVDAKGNVYVSDMDANHIKVFGPDGKFRAVIGRAGQGPGEMQGPTHLVVSGDKLVVWEVMNRRFSILGLDGKFIKIAPAVHGGMGELQALHVLADGRFVAVVERGLPDNFQGRLPDERDEAVVLLSAELAPVSTIFERKIRNRAWTRHPETNGLIQIGFPYHPGLRADVSPDGTIAAGTAQAYEIELLDPDKGSKAVIKRAFQPIKLENRDKEAHFGQFRMNVFAEGRKSVVFKAPDYVRQFTEFPDALPPYRGMIYDGRGRLWVQLFTGDRANNVFDVFSPKGEYLNRVVLEGTAIDTTFTSPYEKAFVGDLLWRIEKDEDGYATLVKYRLTPAK
ncbi:MAG: 6-bladed beta-propeller [Candidatus Aminicenantes bacterium]|nr:6-bladed beta-propeller [Candidatus Aminicenantes bacterium]